MIRVGIDNSLEVARLTNIFLESISLVIQTSVSTDLLNSKSALVDVGTPCAGHDLKWNCVTVLVSPVLVFFRKTDLTR